MARGRLPSSEAADRKQNKAKKKAEKAAKKGDTATQELYHKQARKLEGQSLFANAHRKKHQQKELRQALSKERDDKYSNRFPYT